MTVSHSDYSAASTALSDLMASLNHSFAESVDRSRVLFESGLNAWQEETLALIERRLEHGREALACWQQSEDLSDALAAQRKWMTELASDYRDGMMRAAERVQSALIDGFATTKDGRQAQAGKPGAETAPKPAAAPQDTREYRHHAEDRQTPQAA